MSDEWVIQKEIARQIATKWGRSYVLRIIGRSGKGLRLDEAEDDAKRVYELLKLILPKKTFKKLHVMISQEVSRQIWMEKKKKKYPENKK